jgi:hypothetical protein
MSFKESSMTSLYADLGPYPTIASLSLGEPLNKFLSFFVLTEMGSLFQELNVFSACGKQYPKKSKKHERPAHTTSRYPITQYAFVSQGLMIHLITSFGSF